MLSQPFAGVVLALTDLVAVVRVPGTRLLDDVMYHAKLDDFAFTRNTFTVENIEQRLAKRRRDLVLDDLHPRFIADDFLAALDRANAADVEPHRGIELECVAAGGRLRVAEHHADLHPDLINEYQGRLRLGNGRRQFAKGLRHEPRLEPHVRIPHFAFNFGSRHERCDRVHHDNIDRPAPDERLGNF